MGLLYLQDARSSKAGKTDSLLFLFSDQYLRFFFLHRSHISWRVAPLGLTFSLCLAKSGLSVGHVLKFALVCHIYQWQSQWDPLRKSLLFCIHLISRMSFSLLVLAVLMLIPVCQSPHCAICGRLPSFHFLLNTFFLAISGFLPADPLIWCRHIGLLHINTYCSYITSPRIYFCLLLKALEPQCHLNHLWWCSC